MKTFEHRTIAIEQCQRRSRVDLLFEKGVMMMVNTTQDYV